MGAYCMGIYYDEPELSESDCFYIRLERELEEELTNKTKLLFLKVEPVLLLDFDKLFSEIDNLVNPIPF